MALNIFIRTLRVFKACRVWGVIPFVFGVQAAQKKGARFEDLGTRRSSLSLTAYSRWVVSGFRV